MFEWQSSAWMTIAWIWLSGLGFAFIHSLTASLYLKHRLYHSGLKPHRYRLLYSLLSIVTTMIWLWFVHQLVDTPLYQTEGLLRWLLFVMQGLGLLIALLAFVPIDGAVFLGLRESEQSADPFVIEGIYKYIRHPMYSGAMLMLLAMPAQTVNSLNFSLVICLYFIFGSRFEEKRMRQEHPEYETYQQNVPAFIPKLRGQYA